MAGCDGAGSPAPGPHGHPCPLRSRRSVGSSTAADGARSGAWRGGRRQAPVIVPRLGQLDGAACSSRTPRARPARATNFLDGELCAPGGECLPPRARNQAKDFPHEFAAIRFEFFMRKALVDSAFFPYSTHRNEKLQMPCHGDYRYSTGVKLDLVCWPSIINGTAELSEHVPCEVAGTWRAQIST